MDKYVTHQELEASTEKILHQMDKHFADMQQQIDSRFTDIQQQTDKRFKDIQQQTDKRFNNIELQLNDTKNITKSADWKANWILGILSASVVGVIVAAITTLFH